jgi:hypothetical protein
MKANAARALSALVLACAAAGASAEYRCSPPPTMFDQRACEAAKQGPAALRRFIQRMQPIVHLYFYDYVDRATLLAWEASEARERATAQTDKPAPVAGTSTR